MANETKPKANTFHSSLDVELTCQAFKLPGVYDRKFESNYLQVHSDYKSPQHFHRIFHPYTTFPPNRKYVRSEIINNQATLSSRFSINPGLDSQLINRQFGGNTNTETDNSNGTVGKNDFSGLGLIEMGSIGNRPAASSAIETADHDNRGSYSIVRNKIFGTARQSNISRLERKDINFSSIVDIDDEAFESYVSDDLAGRLGEGNFFRMAMLLIIILNSIMIGIQTDAEMRNLYGPLFSLMDDIFLSIFIMEIIFKWYYAFKTFWKSLWNWLDVTLVIVALLGPLITFGQSSRILKMFRIIRAFRSLRSIQALSGMYTVLQVVGKSIPDMVNISLLLLILMFIFAVVGVTLFGPIYPERFGDLGTALFFLFILVTQDGWVVLFDELEKRGQFAAGAIYCVLFIIIGGFIFSNLIVAVVVTNLEVTYRNIKKQMKSKYRQLKSRTGSQTIPVTRTLVDVEDEDVYRNQIPYELPDFDRMSQVNLEKYYLILMIIEDNLKEYVSIKESLGEILHELKEINRNHPDQEDPLDIRLNNDESDEDIEQVNAGDALTQLINLQKQAS